MFDDFFTRAVLAGIGVAIVAAPLGCFVVWRRVAYFGDTLSHAALLGVAVGLLLEINITLAVFAISVGVALLLTYWQKKSAVPQDALLGILSHGALATGLVCLAFMTWIRFDLSSLLFGDLLSVSKADLLIIYAGGGCILTGLYLIWNKLFASTVSYDLALAEGGNPDRANFIFTMLMAAVVAISLKIVGALLITAMLIIPAAAARRLVNGPEAMAIAAAIIGVLSVLFGLFGSLQWDTPSGPSIVVSATLLFVISLSPLARLIKNIVASDMVETSKGGTHEH